MKKLFIKIFILGCILTVATPLFSDEITKIPPIGFIFNFTSISDPLEGYQGGVGIKLLTKKFNYRFLGDVYHNQQSETSIYSLGITAEKHFFTSKISPYFGLTLAGGYTVEQDPTYADNWIRQTTIPIDFGPVFGIEVFFTSYISFFVEYYASVSYRMVTSTTSVNNVETSVEEDYFIVDTKMGNNASIGITIYLEDQIEIKE